MRIYRILRFVKTAGAAGITAPLRDGRRSVLLADDDAATIILVSTILKHANFDCEVARDGTQAIAVARERKLDLVLLDVSMPQMNGFDALTALRSDPATRDIAVVLVTSHRDEHEVVKAFTLGADDYITKPFHSGELMARIKRIIRQSERD